MDEARCFDESARLIRDEHRGGARVCGVPSTGEEPPPRLPCSAPLPPARLSSLLSSRPRLPPAGFGAGFTFSEQRVSAMCTAARDKFFFGRTATLLFIANFRFPKGFQPLHH
ncbi:unnamed protein product [Lampetra planeri]